MAALITLVSSTPARRNREIRSDSSVGIFMRAPRRPANGRRAFPYCRRLWLRRNPWTSSPVGEKHAHLSTNSEGYRFVEAPAGRPVRTPIAGLTADRRGGQEPALGVWRRLEELQQQRPNLLLAGLGGVGVVIVAHVGDGPGETVGARVHPVSPEIGRPR